MLRRQQLVAKSLYLHGVQSTQLFKFKMNVTTLTPRLFAEEVLNFAVNELRWLPGCRYHYFDIEKNSVIEHMGKAVTLFGVLQQRQVRLRLKRIKNKLMRSRCSFACFAFNFAESFFRQDSQIDQYFFVKILSFCGVMSELALFCFRNDRHIFMDICVDVVEEVLSTKFGNIFSSGGWKKLHEMSCSFAFFYSNMFKECNECEQKIFVT